MMRDFFFVFMVIRLLNEGPIGLKGGIYFSFFHFCHLLLYVNVQPSVSMCQDSRNLLQAPRCSVSVGIPGTCKRKLRSTSASLSKIFNKQQ